MKRVIISLVCAIVFGGLIRHALADEWDDEGNYSSCGGGDYGPVDENTQTYPDYSSSEGGWDYNQGDNPNMPGNLGFDQDTGKSVGSPGAGASEETLEFAPGNESMRTPEGGFAFKMDDGNYYTIENGEAYFYKEGEQGAGQGNIPDAPQPVGVAPDGQFVYKDPQTGGLIFNDGAVVEDPTKVNFYNNGQGESQAGGGGQDAGYFGVVDGNGNKVRVDAEGAFFYDDKDGNRQYYSDLNKENFRAAGSGTKYDLSTGNVELRSDESGSIGAVQKDPSTGKITTFSDGKQSYSVGYNQAGAPFYTNGASQQVLIGGVPGVGVGGGIMGGAGSWLSNLLGLSGGVGYDKSRGGIYGGLGFGSTSGYGASSGGGILSGLFGGGGGTTTTGGFGYTPGQGWSGGAGFSSISGSSYGTGGYGGGYASPMGYFGMGGGGMGWNPANYLGTGLPAGSIYTIIQGIVFWVLAIFGFICIIGFVISGIMYLTAAGDDEQQKKAKKAMYYSITGVIVGLAGLVIIFAVNALLRGASYF